jgi:hypothetical protein
LPSSTAPAKIGGIKETKWKTNNKATPSAIWLENFILILPSKFCISNRKELLIIAKTQTTKEANKVLF